MVKYLKELGYEAVLSNEEKTNYKKEVLARIEAHLDSAFYAVFTYNYLPEMAKICNAKNIYYISWIVDNPHFALESNTVHYHKNRIFTFDRDQWKQLRLRGVKNIFHLPLGVDVEGFEKIRCLNNKFKSDVSFVGTLYNEDSRNLFQQISYLPPYINGYFNALIQAQQKISDTIISYDMISENIWEDVKKHVVLQGVEEYEISYEKQFVDFILKEVTKRERCNTVSLLDRFFDFKLYTGSPTTFDSNLKSEGYINYKTEMPQVFKGSKVNINITLRSISSGIPLRALDIMACGGFLLSNCQRELQEYFEEDNECVFYYNPEDMMKKCAYYIAHDKEREAIAKAGYRKVKNEFSLKLQLEKMKAILEDNE